MKDLGKDEKSISMDKLIAAGLMNFTVPPNTTFARGEEQDGYRLTGFLNKDTKHLVGWGLKVKSCVYTKEAMFDGKGGYEGVSRTVKNNSHELYQKVNGGGILGKVVFSNGPTLYCVDGNHSTTFNQEAEDFYNKLTQTFSAANGPEEMAAKRAEAV